MQNEPLCIPPMILKISGQKSCRCIYAYVIHLVCKFIVHSTKYIINTITLARKLYDHHEITK